MSSKQPSLLASSANITYSWTGLQILPVLGSHSFVFAIFDCCGLNVNSIKRQHYQNHFVNKVVFTKKPPMSISCYNSGLLQLHFITIVIKIGRTRSLKTATGSAHQSSSSTQTVGRSERNNELLITPRDNTTLRAKQSFSSSSTVSSL